MSDTGSPVKTSTEKVVWAHLYWLKGSEIEADGVTHTRKKVVFEIRWIEGINGLGEIIYRGDRYDVEDYREKGRYAFLQIGCVRNE
jgi:hypothetical protein